MCCIILIVWWFISNVIFLLYLTTCINCLFVRVGRPCFLLCGYDFSFEWINDVAVLHIRYIPQVRQLRQLFSWCCLFFIWNLNKWILKYFYGILLICLYSSGTFYYIHIATEKITATEKLFCLKWWWKISV